MVLISLSCGVRCEVDEKLEKLLVFLNKQPRIETRHSCEGTKKMRAYVSMYATPEAVALAHSLLENDGTIGIQIERDIHPYGYPGLVIRWRKQHQKKFEKLVKKHFSKDEI